MTGFTSSTGLFAVKSARRFLPSVSTAVKAVALAATVITIAHALATKPKAEEPKP